MTIGHVKGWKYNFLLMALIWMLRNVPQNEFRSFGTIRSFYEIGYCFVETKDLRLLFPMYRYFFLVFFFLIAKLTL